jgi:hypothetical protein
VQERLSAVIFPMSSPTGVDAFYSRSRKTGRADRKHSPSVRRLLRRDCDVIFLLPFCADDAGLAFRQIWRRLLRLLGSVAQGSRIVSIIFPDCVGSSFRRLEPVERLFLQTAFQAWVPIVKTTLSEEVRIFAVQVGCGFRRFVFRGKLAVARNPKIPSANTFFVRRLAT